MLGSAGIAPTRPVCSCTSSHVVLVCGFSHGVFCAVCWGFGPDVARGSGLALTQARWIWSCCFLPELRSQRMMLMAAVCWCCACGSHVLVDAGTVWARPGCGGSSQLVLLACGCSRRVFWAVCREFGPVVASGSGLAPARAQWTWSSCFFLVLWSHGMTLMAAACWCSGCGSPVRGSIGKAPALPACGCCSQHMVLVVGFSPSVFWAACRESVSDG